MQTSIYDQMHFEATVAPIRDRPQRDRLAHASTELTRPFAERRFSPFRVRVTGFNEPWFIDVSRSLPSSSQSPGRGNHERPYSHTHLAH